MSGPPEAIDPTPARRDEPPGPDGPDPVQSAIAAVMASLRQGRRPSLSDLIARHPEHAEEIKEVLSALLLVEDVAGEARVSPPALDGGICLDGKGTARLGELRILREIGRGGMGIVYEAVQESLGRTVALKVLPHHATMEERLLERFRREARAVAALHHPNIVPVFGIGEESGIHYYTMQLIQGHSLDDVLRDVRRLRGGDGEALEPYPPLLRSAMTFVGRVPATSTTGVQAEDLAEPGRQAPAEPTTPPSSVLLATATTAGSSARTRDLYFENVARVGLQVAEALAYAHEQGVLHRDIKPSNLLLDTRDRVWVADFGLAKLADGSQLTHTGEIVGSLPYMAPERFRGWSDARSDVYSLGGTLYECLTLRPAFTDGDRGRLVQKVTGEEPLAPRRIDPSIPQDLETIVLKAMEKEPERRYQSATALARDLKHFLEDRPIQARRASGVEKVWRWCQRNRALAGTGAAACFFVALAALTLLAYVWVRTERNAAVTAEREARYWEAFAQARLKRSSGQRGQRLESLELLGTATGQISKLDLPPDALASRRTELRNEAIACMSLDDLEVAVEWQGAPEGMTSLAFDQDLERYARGDVRGNADVRSVGTDQEIASLPAGGGPVINLRFCPGAAYLVAEYKLGSSSEARIWDLARRASVLDLVLPSLGQGLASTDSVDFSPDGSRLGAALEGGAIRLHDLPSAALASELAPDELSLPGRLRFHPGGSKLAVASSSRAPPFAVHVRGLDTGAVLSRFGFGAALGRLAWHPGGRLLAVACEDGRVHIADTETGRVRTADVEGLSPEASVAYNRSGDVLASLSWDRWIRLRDPCTGQARLQTFAGTLGPSLRFSRGTDLLAGGVFDAEVRLWRVRAARERRAIHGPLETTTATIFGMNWHCFSPDSRLIATTHFDGVRLWDAVRAVEVAHLPLRDARSVHFHPSGAFLLTSSQAGCLRWPLVQAAAGSPAALAIGPPEPLGLSVRSELWTSALSQDGRMLFIGHGPDGHFHFLDLETGAERLSGGLHAGHRWVDIAPDGSWAVSSTGLGWQGLAVKLWDARTGACVRSLDVPSPLTLAVSHDGKHLATGGKAEHRVMEVSSWQVVRSLPQEQTSSMGTLAFSRDDRVLACSQGPSAVQLVDLGSGSELARLDHPGLGVTCLSFSPDDRWLAATTGSSALYLWDLRLIRGQLRDLGLDWDPPLPAAGVEAEPPPPFRATVATAALPLPTDVVIHEERAQCAARIAAEKAAAAGR